jgi:hypothetical protein
MNLAKIAAAVVPVVLLAACGSAHLAGSAPTTVARSAPASTRSATASTAARPARKPASIQRTASKPTSADWLGTPGGQAQVMFMQTVDTLAVDLHTESQAPTVANHLVFEADARVLGAQAQKLLASPGLLPRTGRAAYITMLNDFITVANLLQPGPGYGTTAQDYAAWNKAENATGGNWS